MYAPTRGGTRGGQGDFKWTDVANDKDRENYLGHSLNAPVGRWQKNKDITWYNRDKKDNEEDARKAEMRAVKQAEADALSIAMGFAPGTRPVGILAPANGDDSEAKEEEAEQAKAEKRARKDERRREKEAKRAERAERKAHRHRSRSRSRSPVRRYEERDEPRRRHDHEDDRRHRDERSRHDERDRDDRHRRREDDDRPRRDYDRR